ncbi:MAG: hypothetical protein A3H79_04785 [Candidatus Levybacteria bacterium RIFCSPLOWO2_02_FULL_36_8b]|nr:MAG: hypothetical protein A3H79_04785 [Candidatus Levybacteria bacterium RIFCSPLOWO2_02_FULL_36_8b]
MNESSNIIILHGWGLNGQKYEKLSQLLEKKGYKVFAPDFPGFGSEPLKSESMDLGDYVEFLNNLIKKNKISKPILIGHSFGGRVALRYGFENPSKVSKLILTGTPIIREKSFSKKIAYAGAVIGGRIFKKFPDIQKERIRKVLYFAIGEWDYYKAGSLKQVFKNIIGEDLIKYIKEIKIPVFLIWGKNDKIVPAKYLKDIKKLNREVIYKTVPGVGHKLPYEKPEQFFEEIKSLI